MPAASIITQNLPPAPGPTMSSTVTKNNVATIPTPSVFSLGAQISTVLTPQPSKPASSPVIPVDKKTLGNANQFATMETVTQGLALSPTYQIPPACTVSVSSAIPSSPEPAVMREPMDETADDMMPSIVVSSPPLGSQSTPFVVPASSSSGGEANVKSMEGKDGFNPGNNILMQASREDGRSKESEVVREEPTHLDIHSGIMEKSRESRGSKMSLESIARGKEDEEEEEEEVSLDLDLMFGGSQQQQPQQHHTETPNRNDAPKEDGLSAEKPRSPMNFSLMFGGDSPVRHDTTKEEKPTPEVGETATSSKTSPKAQSLPGHEAAASKPAAAV